MSTPTITETTTTPRTRWAGIIWGLLFAATAATALWMLSDADRRATIGDGLLALTPTTIVTIILLTIGVLLLANGAVGLVRRVQRKLASTDTRQDGVVPRVEVPGSLAE
ncbi:hypothetical protein [Microbacterium oxydans]|uniref:hypothetical protein n=1 Tax=Microbacterium oxydans TaxID=82380 RepID=UPI00226B8CC9|nr:hypothetical protein [Microbacterium oxydans]WAA65441.1 hypothetical protein MME74_14560 [Microbacterium oxydans]